MEKVFELLQSNPNRIWAIESAAVENDETEIEPK